MKRLLLIVAIVVVVAGIAVAAYLFFFAKPAKLTVTTPSASLGTDSSTRTQEAATSVPTRVATNLVRIASQPVAAGVAVFDITRDSSSTPTTASTTASTTSSTSMPDVEIRYIDRQSGNIYSYVVGENSLTRISNKTLPGIQQASWTPDGSLALVRFLSKTNGAESLDTYLLPADGTGGYFLQAGLDQATITGSSTLFTLSASADGSVGTVAHTDGSNPHTAFTSQLSDIHVFSTANGLMASEKAANSLNGYLFSVNSGSLTPVLGPYRGLTTLPSPSGKYVLFSYTDGTQFYLYMYDMAQGTATLLPVKTLAEKCVWSSTSTSVYCGIPHTISGTEPDDWYQGAATFTDQIWRIDLNSRLATLIVDPTNAGKTAIDAVDLALDAQNKVLVFRNKKDSTLWAYSL